MTKSTPTSSKPTGSRPTPLNQTEQGKQQKLDGKPLGTPLAGLRTEVNPAQQLTGKRQPVLDFVEDDEALDHNASPVIEVANLDSLEDELRYLGGDYDRLIIEADRCSEEATDPRQLLLINQADHDALLKNPHFSFDSRCKLLWFLKKMRTSSWMRMADEGLYVPRVCLGLAAGFEYGGRMALCGLHSHFCQQPDYCPRCCLRLRAKPAVREYRDAFEQAPHWMMLTPSFERNPEQAGLHYVIQKGNRSRRVKARLRHFQPFADLGLPAKEPLTPDHDIGKVNPIATCFEAIFRLGRELIRCGVAQGVFAHREIAWNFEARPVRCWVTPNGTLIINSEEPITFEIACKVYELFVGLYEALPFGNCLYPDLHCEAILSQKELSRCLYYALKPMKYAPGYLRAVEAVADLEALNIEIADRVFQGGSVILGVHRSPRRLGNMRCNADGYLGAGSVTADRMQQTELKREGHANQQGAKHGAGMTDLEKAIGRGSLNRREGLNE
jgi:hypothetical protein